MHTLLLRLAGPMQSWGIQSRFSVRDTALDPSKSGIIGLLCAALGWPRTADLARLAALHMGARVDQQGRLSYDFHTAQNVLKAAGGIKGTEPSRRYYLADAVFLVGLEGRDLALLQKLHAALCHPVWPLFLGRKAFVPGAPIWLPDGLREESDLVTALGAYPWLGSPRLEQPDRLRLVIEDAHGAEVRLDQPLSFSDRRFAPRHVTTTFVSLPKPQPEDVCTSPDLS